MKVYIAGAIGFFIGTFFGVLLLGIMQMIREGGTHEKTLLERRRKDGAGEFRKPADYHNHFIANRRRSICPSGSDELGEAGNSDHRVLHYVNGHLGISKGSGGKVNG